MKKFFKRLLCYIPLLVMAFLLLTGWIFAPDSLDLIDNTIQKLINWTEK